MGGSTDIADEEQELIQSLLEINFVLSYKVNLAYLKMQLSPILGIDPKKLTRSNINAPQQENRSINCGIHTDDDFTSQKITTATCSNMDEF